MKPLKDVVQEIEFSELEDSKGSEELYKDFEDTVRNLFFTYVKDRDELDKHDFHVRHGVVNSLRGKQISFGKYGSLYLTKSVKHSFTGFHLDGMESLSKKVKYLVRKSKLPIKYSEKNSNILKGIFEGIDRTKPLRQLVRDMIKGIDRSWDQTYSSLYLCVLKYVYFVFLSHSSNSTTFAVTGDTYQLMLSPYLQDYIKDYPLYMYRQDAVMFPEGNQWINSPEFKLIEDEPIISICIPWDYEVEDYKYAFEPFDIQRYENSCKYMAFATEKRLAMFKNLTRVIDLGKIYRYISDTSYFIPEVSKDKTFRKIDHLEMTDLIQEIEHPTLTCMEFIRKQIYVSPNNIRDTFIPSWKTFCALYVVESLCDQFMAQAPEIRIGKVNSNLKYNSKYFAMIDIKKFGIMFPKEVIISVLQGMERAMNVDLSYIINAYRNYILYVDGTATTPTRGFGLGNMNKLATLAHYMIAKVSELKFYVYSDDIVYMFDVEPDESVLERFRRLYEDFGMTLNMKKCYLSSNWEFLGQSSHEYYDYVESAQCSTSFTEAFFSPTLIQGEMLERNTLSTFCESRDLWLKNHEINPILRSDLIVYPESMGGWVRTNQPWSYCEEGGLTPSTFTAIRSVPKKFIQRTPDEVYVTHSKADYYLDSVVRHFSIDERRKMSNWKILKFWEQEERRYKKAPIGNKGLLSMMYFGISHLDIPKSYLVERKSPSQLKCYVKIPSIVNNGKIPNPYPIISVRKSDELLLKKLSMFTDFPIYTKYMLELKSKMAIMDIKFDPPYQTDKYLYEINLITYITQIKESPMDFVIPEKLDHEPLIFEWLDLSYMDPISKYRIDHEEEEDFVKDFDDLDGVIVTEEEELEVETNLDFDELENI